MGPARAVGLSSSFVGAEMTMAGGRARHVAFRHAETLSKGREQLSKRGLDGLRDFRNHTVVGSGCHRSAHVPVKGKESAWAR